MKKKALALAVAVAMAAAVGCGAKETAKAVEPSRFIHTSETDFNFDTYITTFVDKETGVEYIWVDGYKNGGLTVLLNADGTPKIAEGY